MVDIYSCAGNTTLYFAKSAVGQGLKGWGKFRNEKAWVSLAKVAVYAS